LCRACPVNCASGNCLIYTSLYIDCYGYSIANYIITADTTHSADKACPANYITIIDADQSAYTAWSTDKTN
jgi:hypothetical protein